MPNYLGKSLKRAIATPSPGPTCYAGRTLKHESTPTESRIRLLSFSRRPGLFAAAIVLGVMATIGCEKTEPIVSYTVPTEIPEVLRAEKDRMLAAIVPQDDQVWFFKVTGPQSAIEDLQETLKGYIQSIEFADGKPVLDKLPEGWRRGGDKPMRYATIDVETEGKQLNISVSQLARQEDWDEQVKLNVNRWRGQLGLESSDERWAEAVPLEVAAADTTSVWVDLVAEAAASDAMTSPHGGSIPGRFPGGPPSGVAEAPAGRDTAEASNQDTDPQEPLAADPRLKFERPEGWRDGRMSSMRMAAFSMGPEDSPAELTVIPAGGDLRGNVQRWLSQVRDGNVTDEIVDQALDEAQKIDVDGRPSQRFLLTGEDSTKGTAIDATIVPIEGGISLFVKMTGPAETVTEQADAIASFLKSLELNL